MEIPKTQQELIRLLFEQDKHIKSLRTALNRLQTKVVQVAQITERVQGDNIRLRERSQRLDEQVRDLKRKLIK